MNSSQKNRGDVIYWVIAVILILTGTAAPIGILMIVLKLLGGGRRSRQQTYSSSRSQGPVGARTTWQAVPSSSRYRTPPVQNGAAPGYRRDAPPQSQTAWNQVQPGYREQGPVQGQAPEAKEKTPLEKFAVSARNITVIGGAVTAIFALAFASALLSGSSMTEVILILCFTCAGAGALWAGIRRQKQLKRFRSYLAMIGHRSSISVSSLAAATGLKPSRVRDDLTDMLDCGILPQGFLDCGSDRLILSAEGLQEEPEEKKKEEAPLEEEKEEPGAAGDVLAEIREVNRMIDNRKMSAQIDRIEAITAKILDYQKSHPEREAQLHTFLSYYLPTTLKILRAYAQLEDQQVEGENITSAMKRIEGMMDKVVDGFEKQLDQLFQGDVMDITSDVEVLERMMARDGLTGKDGITLTL